MNNPEEPQVQKQLRKPFCKRTLRFTREGFNNFQHHKAKLQISLGRPISDSVALDSLISKGII